MALINFKQARLPDDPTLKSLFNIARDAYGAFMDGVAANPYMKGQKTAVNSRMSEEFSKSIDQLKTLMFLPDLEAAAAREIICIGLVKHACTSAENNFAENSDVTKVATAEKIRAVYNSSGYECPDLDVLSRLPRLEDLSGLSDESKTFAALHVMRFAEAALIDSAYVNEDPVVAERQSKIKKTLVHQSASIAQGTIPDTLHLMMTKAVAKLQMV